jgi:divalent metal cation (Fe/Co/Zn/Cd) transporter
MMPNHLSPLGIFHTSISILAVLAALFALARFGKIDPKTGAGKIYIALTIIACITAFPIMKTGHFSAGHGLAVIVLLLLIVGVFAKSVGVFGRKAEYIQTIAMSATLFFSMIPATIETLTRLPISHPLAAGPNDPVAKTGLMILVLLFVVGVLYQLIKLKTRKKIVTQSTVS